MEQEKYGQVLSGVFGAIAAALLSPEINWRKVSVIAVTGSGFAVFVVPYFCERIGLVSPRALSAAGFLGGFLGCTILGALLSWAQTHDWFTALLDRILRRP